MRKHISTIHAEKERNKHRNTVLILVSSAFLLGGILGHLVYNKLPASQYVTLFLNESVSSPTIMQAIWGVFRWPLGILVLRVLPLTGLFIPGFMALKGFFLSYSIAAFAGEHMKYAICALGPVCILTLPVLFLLSTEILLRKAREQSECNPAVILACFLALCLCVVIDLTVVPMLLS